jgi:CRISPR-associated protein Cmr2
MSSLLAISVGPVQEFIAAARRTRDLWFGSYLLSEISRAVAKAVEDQDGQLIFPASSGPEAENVANVVLAELALGAPAEAAAKAKEAAQRQWLEFAEGARSQLQLAGVVNTDIWEDQVDDVIEFYAAWVPRSDNYQHDRARVMRLLAGRKNCRDFLADGGRAGVPKSSLDGQRESVLLQPPPGANRKTFRDNWPKILRLSSGEELDVVGVTKRLGTKRGDSSASYPSVARVAAETWLRGVRKEPAFKDLRNACAAVTGLHQVAEAKYDYFPYEGTVSFKDRHTDLIKELGEEATEPLRQVAKALNDLGGEPNPYLAVLVADGDSMGAKLSTITRSDEHREFSATLAGFASAARATVDQHCGVLIYAGGDDVLALLPLHTCLPCARELRNKFNERTGMTLSVGIAIGHFMESLEDLRDYGRKAEQAAKAVKGKGALALHLRKRGGSPVELRARWNANPDQRILHFADLINDKIIPAKLPYELRATAQLYKDWPTDQARTAIALDLVRLIAKKQSKGTETVRKALSPYLQQMTTEKLLDFAAELLVARQMASALRQAGVRPVMEMTS